MSVHVHHAHLNSTKEIDLLNLTHDVKRALRESKALNGIITIYIPGSTAAVTILENDPEIHQQIKELVKSFVIETKIARPDRKSGSGKASAHIRAAFLSPSVTIPIKEGRLLMGPWQEVIVFDFDDKPGRREVIIHVMGVEEEKAKQPQRR